MQIKPYYPEGRAALELRNKVAAIHANAVADGLRGTTYRKKQRVSVKEKGGG